ncbi:MAG: EAL domain-containing protein [Oceanospirillaceae bacterium]|nr:EAL domain-containing protein [Oceanospirillaceae bacterium]
MTESIKPLRLLTALLSLLMLLSVLGFGWFSWQEVRQDVTQELHQQNSDFIDQTEAFFRHQEQLLLSVMQPLVRDNKLRRSELEMALDKLTTAVPELQSLGILDRRGEMLLTVGAAIPKNVASLSSDAITQARYTGRLKIGSLYASDDLNSPQLPAFVALQDDNGNPLAFVVAGYSINGDRSIWSTVRSPDGAGLWLLGDDGRARFAHPMTGGLLRNISQWKLDALALDQLLERGAYGSSGEVFPLTLDGEPVLVQSQLLPQYQFVSVAFMPLNRQFWLWTGKVQSVGLLLALFLLISLLVYRLVWLANSRLENARLLAEGNLSKLSQAIEQSQDSVVVTDSSWCIEYANRRFEGDVKQDESRLKGVPVTNFAPHDMLRQDLVQIQSKVAETGSWCGERRREGTEQWYEFSISAVESPETDQSSFILIAQDISERKHAEARLYQQANFDSLTGLPNRRRASEVISGAVHDAWSKKGQLGVLYLDLDNFKTINDTFGHLFGDKVLIQVADRLQKVVDDYGHLAHMSGDEFLIHFPFTEVAEVETVAANILRAFREPLLFQGKNLNISTSIGIARYPVDSPDVQGLIRDADIALYESKRRGRNRYTFFDAELDKRMKRKLEIENQLPNALKSGELYMVYQTKNRIGNGEVVGFEALMRMNCKVLGQVGPDEFIEVAEETGFIEAMGRFALMRGCEDLARLQKLSGKPLTMAINMSVRQLGSDDIIGHVREAIEYSGIDPTTLELEITETLLAENVEVIMPRLDKLRALGLSLTIDDFGTGYSSLAYLTRFPVSTLKIDKCFVNDMATSHNDATVARTVIQMAHALELKVVAEGIEDEAQWGMLRRFGCDIGQGYLFSRPIPFDEVCNLLETTANIPLLEPIKQ